MTPEQNAAIAALKARHEGQYPIAFRVLCAAIDEAASIFSLPSVSETGEEDVERALASKLTKANYRIGSLEQKLGASTAEIARQSAAIAWLHGAYKQECDFPLAALENSLVHMPVVEAASMRPTKKDADLSGEPTS